ncbi:MAG: cupin domain-containing protein [Rhodospirillales bacterium]|jgi:quercetin dioxygenase-like cupin family protein
MKYFHRIIDEKRDMVAAHISSAEIGMVEGERISAGVVEKKQGSGSQPHRHPKVEQFNYVLQGKFKAMVEGEHHEMVPGDMVHIPANALHQMVAIGEGLNIYFMAKDAGSDPELGIMGYAEDKNVDRPWYEPGFEPENKK